MSDVPKLTRGQSLLLAAYQATSPKGPTGSGMKGSLMALGLIRYPSDSELELTPLGRAALDKAIAEGVLGGNEAELRELLREAVVYLAAPSDGLPDERNRVQESHIIARAAALGVTVGEGKG